MPLSVDRTNVTTVRLDLRDTDGRTTFGELRAFVAECERRGAGDDSFAIVASVAGLLSGSAFAPIIGVSIDHRDESAPLEVTSDGQ